MPMVRLDSCASRRALRLLPPLIALLLAAPSPAQDTIQIHGFGSWAYGETDGNLFLVGSEEGNYENADFALNLTAPTGDRVTLVAQVFFELADSFVDEEEDVEVDLDYAFAEIFLSDLAKMRIGRVKHPFGIYTEVFNVGTVRPFFTLPQSIYGPQGIVNKAYNGVGFTGARGGGAEGWGFQYDVYGGQLEADIEYPGVLSNNPQQDFQQPRVSATTKVDDMIGTRLNLLTPVEGLLFGFSAYEGDSEVQSANPSAPPVAVLTETVLGAHVDYFGDRLWVRSEWADLDRDDFGYDGYYVEVAYKVTPHWQLAIRQEDWSAAVPGIDTSTFPQFFQQVLEHEELAFGVNYWITPSVVLRLSYHLAEGNRFAFPEDPDAILNAILTNELEDETDLLVFGMQFSF